MRVVVCLQILLLLSGCAIRYKDNKDVEHLIGFVSIATKSENCIIKNKIKSLGLMVDTTNESGGVNIGYKEVSQTYLLNNSYLEIDAENNITKGNAVCNMTFNNVN